MKKILFCLAAFAALVSCTKENPVDETPAVQYQTITFEAAAPSAEDVDATKTTLVDGNLVHWSNGDQVKVGFFPITGKDNTIVSSVGTFTSTSDQETVASSWFTTDSWNWNSNNDQYRDNGLAVYPSSATIYSKRSGNWKDADTEVSYDLPAEQIAVLNSFQSGVNFSYAKVNKTDFIANKASLNFINACALLKITLPSTAADVKSIAVSSKNDVALSGKFEIPFGKEGYYHDDPWATGYANSDGTLTFQAVAGNPSVSIVAPEGETLQPGGTYYVVVWPGTHGSGLDFEFTNSEGATCKKSLTSSVSFARAKVERFNFVNNIDFVKESILEISQTSLNLEAVNGSSASFTVYSNYSWTATSDQPWISITPATGNASLSEQTITISATENDRDAIRTATVTVENETGISKTITITQQAPSMSIKIMYEPIDYKDLYNFAVVTSNVDWKISSDQSWLTFQQTSGSGDANIKLVYSENPESVDRTATITLTNTSGTIVKTTTFTQPAKPKTYYIVNQVTEASALENGAFYVIEFYGYSNYYWKIDSNGNVLRSYVNKTNGFTEEYVYRFEKTNYSNPIGGYNSYSTGHLWSAKSDKYFNWYDLNFADGHKTDLVFENRYGGETGSEIDIYEHYSPYRTIYYTGSKLAWGETGQSNRKWNIYKVEVR